MMKQKQRVTDFHQNLVFCRAELKILYPASAVALARTGRVLPNPCF